MVLVVITSDRGLCGSYNSYVLALLRRTIDELKAAGVDMSEPATVELALAHFAKLVDEFVG